MSTTRFATRRGYLLNRFAYTCAGIALIYAIFVNDSTRWTVTIIAAAVAVISYLLADKLDKKGVRTVEVDDNGNAKKKIL